MARNHVADRTRNKRGPKMEDKNEQSTVNSSNVTDDNDEDEPEVLIIPSSSSDSLNNENEDEHEEEEEEEEGEEEGDVVEVDKDEEEEAKSSDVTNQRSNNKKEDTKKKEKNQKKNQKMEEEDEKNESALYRFPVNRINRIIRSEDSDIRITQEAVFLINKASEKFLELFCKEAYACSFLERKKYVGYQHLSSVVSRRRRFDFLSDFVPEKVKAEDALADMSSAPGWDLGEDKSTLV